MGNIKIILTGVCLVFILATCKKDKEQDVVTRQELKGMVYNNCTDSGLAGVKVYLRTYKDNKGIASMETVSDANGDFSFTDAELHSSSKYSYAIYIPSISGIGANNPELSVFNGTTIYFTGKEVNANTFLRPKVTPGFFNFCYTINHVDTIKSPDSISIYFEQKTLRKNVPNSTYGYPENSINGKGKMVSNIPPIVSTAGSCMGSRWMGKWHVTVEKIKSGIYSFTQDSIYISWKGSNSYTINW